MPLSLIERFLVQTESIVFMRDPNGIKIALNCANSEAAGIKPELMASDF